jgi:hypothetical protein
VSATSVDPISGVDLSATQNQIHGPTRSIMVLGVNSFESPETRLIAAWLIVLQEPGEEIIALGFQTNLPLSVDDNRSLESEFGFSFQAGLPPHFTTLVERMSPFGAPDAFIVMDGDFFSALVDYLGGVPAGEVFIDGAEILAINLLLLDKPASLLETQAQSLDMLRFQLALRGTEFDITELLSLAANHTYLSADPTQLALWASPYIPFDPGKIRIETMPDLESRP